MKPDTQTRIELLKKYYAYDEVSKTFTVSLHYEKVSDILYKEVKSVSNVPMMNDEMKRGPSIISKLNRITLLNKDNKVLVDEKYEQIQKHFYRSAPIRRIGSLLLLFSGFAFIGLSIMLLIKTIPNISLAFQYFKAILLLHLL